MLPQERSGLERASYIYALLDPFTQECRYIGKSVEPDRRHRYHCTVYDKSSPHKQHWVSKLTCKGAVPELVILEQTTAGCANDKEIFWIAYFKFLGARLTNISKGGNGGDFTEETKKLISQQSKARWSDPAYRVKQSAAQKAGMTAEGRNSSREKAIARLKDPVVYAKQKAVLLDPINQEKRVIKLREWAISDTNREMKRKQMKLRMSDPLQVEYLRRNTRTPEAIAKHRAKTQSTDARKRMSDVQTKLWADPIYAKKTIAAAKSARAQKLVDDPEYRARLVATQKRVVASEKWRSALKQAMQNPETLKKMSVATAGRWAVMTEEKRQAQLSKLSAAQKDRYKNMTQAQREDLNRRISEGGAGQPKKAVCKRGHPRTPENLTKSSSCKICVKLSKSQRKTSPSE